jgi:hypothetical protein
LALAASPPSALAETAAASNLTALLNLAPMTSSTRRFVALGTDNVAKLDALRWAEETAGLIKTLTGKPLPFENRSFTLVLRETPDAAWRVEASQNRSGAQLAQRLIVWNYARADMEHALEELCLLLLNGYVLQSHESADSGLWKWDAQPPPLPVPYWLAAGLAQNLYPSLRARNSRVVVQRLEEGRVITASEFLRRGVQRPAAPKTAATESAQALRPDFAPVDSVACGVFVGWLLSLPESATLLQRLFVRLGNGQSISPEWLSESVPGCTSPTDLDERWDGWVLRQKRMVREPGVVTPAAMTQLNAELLLYPGVSGIPLAANPGQSFGLADLIPRRTETWAPAFVRLKSERLRLLAVGQGPEFVEVAERYCRFLQALAANASERKLQSLLQEAQRRQAELAEKLSQSDADTQDHRR